MLSTDNPPIVHAVGLGTVNNVRRIVDRARAVGALTVVDASQSAPHRPLDVQELGADFVAFTGHKLYGPKGAGALYVRRKNPRVQLVPLIDGGGHERGMRSGTLNVPGIAGLGISHRPANFDRRRVDAWSRGLKIRVSGFNSLPVMRLQDARNAGTMQAWRSRSISVMFPRKSATS